MHYRTGKGDFDDIYGGRGRFLDDETFLRLRGERSAAAVKLLAAIDGNAQAGAPAAGGQSQGGLLPVTLLDPELPAQWRLRLYFWFIARYVAAFIFRR